MRGIWVFRGRLGRLFSLLPCFDKLSKFLTIFLGGFSEVLGDDHFHEPGNSHPMGIRIFLDALMSEPFDADTAAGLDLLSHKKERKGASAWKRPLLG